MIRTALMVAAATAISVVDGTAAAGIGDDARVVRGLDHAMMRRYPASPWKPVRADGRVPVLADIRCDATCAVAVDHDNTVVLTPGAVISVSDWFYVPLEPDGKRLTAAHRILLSEGLIEAVSPSQRGVPLVVTVGPSEHVALRAAHVQITHKEGRTAVGVTEGEARAGASRSWITLKTKESTILVPHDRPKAPSAMVQAPQWTTQNGACTASPLAVSNEGHDAMVGTCWDTVAKGTGYQVDLARDAAFHELVGPSESTASKSWSKMLGVGRYFIRVRSIDADGLTSDPSPARKMAVVPMILPPGSLADLTHGTLVLPEGRDVSFGNADGLDVAIDNGGFLKAPSAMRMDGAPSHQLRIRLSDDPSSVSTVHIMRRALRADVRISPKTARWPADPIDIAVTIEDPTGVAQTDKVEPQLHVLLGLTEVNLRWSHQGAVWSARVEPRRMGGPVVLRVIANDEHGIPLGRNFVEIDGDQTHSDAETSPKWRSAAR